MSRQNSFIVSFCFAALVATPSLPAQTHAGKQNTPVGGRPIQAEVDTSNVPQLPSSFRVHEKVLTLFATQFTIDNGGKKYGTIDKKVFSLTTAFTYKDGAGKTQSIAKARFFSLGSTVDITDANGKVIGTIQEKIFKSLFKVSTEYAILDANGREVATSDKLDLFATKFTLKDKSGKTVVEMKRPMINWLSDNWDVKVYDAKAIDPRILIMIPAFKTAADNSRKLND